MSEIVNTPVIKKDSLELLSGTPLFTDDLAPKNCLIVKVLRSPHANAIVEEIDTTKALALDDVEAVFTWKDIDQDASRFTNAGQTYPEPSPYDRLILDRHVRFAGDAVALVAAYTEEAANKALKLIKVKYQVLEAVLDYHTALDNPVLVHPEENWKNLSNQGDNKRNLVAHGHEKRGDVDKVLADCEFVVEHTYHTKPVNQTMMETFRAFATIDAYGRLNVMASTQIVFHARRIIANALRIPKSMVRVTKPRIGGGFGAKQTLVCEFYPAFVTWMTKKPSKIVYSRKEAMIASSPRHEMEVKVRVGADRDGVIKAIDMKVLSNTGAYGEHGPTTVGLAAHKSIPMYGKVEAWRFRYDVVYTNHQASGAYRGYGAPQGIFAVESAVNELADRIGMNRFKIRDINVVREGEVMSAYYGETNSSCALDKCLKKVKEMISWKEKYPCQDMGDGKVRAVGMAMAMQGSCISGCDVGVCRIKLNDEGFYTVMTGSGEMGQGCDTVLAQIAAEVLECPMERIIIAAGDTDVSPYNSGSYASGTTFNTGKAVEISAMMMRKKIIKAGAGMLGIGEGRAEFDGAKVFVMDNPGKFVSLSDIVWASQCGHDGIDLESTYSHSNPNGCPPYQAGAVEIEVDTLTGEVKVLEYDTCLDCGTPINPNLVKVQVEGGGLQGIGMALFEDVNYRENGAPKEDSFLSYRIPSRLDAPVMKVAFESSYENQGAFGAKSCGEIVINIPGPAIADAIFNATGLRFTELPITAEQIAMGMAAKRD